VDFGIHILNRISNMFLLPSRMLAVSRVLKTTIHALQVPFSLEMCGNKVIDSLVKGL